ncbi:MAG TPA: flippase [Chloroflexota bacterium]|nr:flippase [Chloroflexota bacterium]
MAPGAPTGRRAAWNAIALLGFRAVQFAVNLFITLALTRHLGAGSYGDYVFVLGFTGTLVVLSDFGLIKVAVREIARDPSIESAVVGTVIGLRCGIGLALALAAQVILVLIHSRDELRGLVLVASVWFISDALLAIAILFQVRIAMHVEALMGLAGCALQGLAAIWLIGRGGGLEELVLLPAIGGFGAAMVGMYLAAVRYRLPARFDLRLIPPLAAAGLPVWTTVAFTMVNLRLDGVLLGVLATPTDVGLYGAASKPIEYVFLLSTALMNPAYPLLARWFHRDLDRFAFVYRRMVTVLAVVALPIPVALFFLAGPIVAALFPPEFAGSASALQLLGAAMAFTFLTAWHGFTLLAAGRQRDTVVYDGAALVANVGLNLVLVPRMGFMGAAWAALGTSALAVVWSTVMARRIGVSIAAGELVRACVAAGAFGAALGVSQAAGLPALVAAGAALAAYVLAVLALRIVRWREIAELAPGARAGRPALPVLEGV